jgi:hypothetical protein
MSNIKQVEITGTLPFDCYDDQEFQPFLAAMNGPAFGLKIQYGRETTMRPSEHGGQQTMYPFTISGLEAVAWPWLEKLVEIIKRLGTVETDSSFDWEERMAR